MKGSEIIPLNVVSTPVEQTDELNKVLNIMAKIYVVCGDCEPMLVFMSTNATKPVAAGSNPKSKYSCRDAHMISFLQSSTDSTHVAENESGA